MNEQVNFSNNLNKGRMYHTVTNESHLWTGVLSHGIPTPFTYILNRFVVVDTVVPTSWMELEHCVTRETSQDMQWKRRQTLKAPRWS